MGKILNTTIRFGIGSLLLLLLGSGCSDNGCFEERSSIPLVKLYDSSTGKPIVVDSITVYGIGQMENALLLDTARSVSQFSLPLRIPNEEGAVDSVSYVIAYNTIKGENSHLTNDTLTLRYTAYPYFDSMECGAMYNFTIQGYSYTRHTEFMLLDSVAIVQSEINNENVENIQLFYPVQ